MGNFFIRRPIVAMVLSIVMVIVGAVALTGLPIAKYPEIVPPMIQVTTTYVGAERARRGAVGRHADRAEGERRRAVHLHEVHQRQRRHAQDRGHRSRWAPTSTSSNVLVQNRVSQATPVLPRSEAVRRE